MAKSKRLTRTYRIKDKVYGPSTPTKDVPEQLWAREKELATPEVQKKLARRYGAGRILPGKDLVPEVTHEAIEEAGEEEATQSSVEDTASMDATVTQKVEENTESEADSGDE
jgi:hypothetical protein